MFLNVLFYAFWPNFESNLLCFSVLFLVRFRGAFRGHFYWKKRLFKQSYALCYFLLILPSFPWPTVYHIKNKNAVCSPTWLPWLVDLWSSPVYHWEPIWETNLILKQMNQFCCWKWISRTPPFVAKILDILWLSLQIRHCASHRVNFLASILTSSPHFAFRSSFRTQQQQQRHLAVIIRRLNWMRENRPAYNSLAVFVCTHFSS